MLFTPDSFPKDLDGSNNLIKEMPSISQWKVVIGIVILDTTKEARQIWIRTVTTFLFHHLSNLPSQNEKGGWMIRTDFFLYYLETY